MCQGPSIVYQSEFCPSLLGTHHDWSPFFGWISTWSSTNFHSLSWIPVRSKTPSSSYRGMVANAKTVPQKKRWITKKESEGLTKGGTTLPEFYPLNLDMPPAYGDQIFKSLYSRALHGQISHRPVSRLVASYSVAMLQVSHVVDWQKYGVPQNRWFIMEKPFKVDDLRVPLFWETTICCISHMGSHHLLYIPHVTYITIKSPITSQAFLLKS